MSLIFGRRCLFCGIYIKPWGRVSHERWHADQVAHIRTLLCIPCFTDHGKMHASCGKYPECRCVCNAFADNDGGD